MRLAALLIPVLVAVPITTAAAQQKPAPAVLVGTVTDRDRKPIPDVSVDISSGRFREHAVTNDKGRFRVAKLPTDSLVMIVRRVGLVPMTFDMLLVDGENDVSITMEQVPQMLDAVRSETAQTGLFGVVGDTAYEIVAGASVATVVHKDQTTTNEKGQFFFDPVKPGPDIVDVRKL